MSNFFEDLKKYFSETPKNEILEVWTKSAELDSIGVSVDEFLLNSHHQYYVYSSDPNITCLGYLTDNLNPKFTSGFFI